MYRRFWFNHPDMKFRRQNLRNNATNCELILWQELKGSNLGYKFIRQYSIRNWVVDFYCPKLRLVIEVDGGMHQNQKNKDLNRDETLKTIGINTLRIKNEEIEENVDKVKTKIRKHITSLSSPLLN